MYWKELQNLSQDKRMLSEYLLNEYGQRKLARKSAMKTKMPAKIVLLASCAASKTQQAEPTLQIRNVKEGGYDSVLSSWLSSIEGATNLSPALELYKVDTEA